MNIKNPTKDKPVRIFPKNIEKPIKKYAYLLDFWKTKQEFINITIEATSPREYKMPCHQGISKKSGDSMSNRKLIFQLK